MLRLDAIIKSLPKHKAKAYMTWQAEVLGDSAVADVVSISKYLESQEQSPEPRNSRGFIGSRPNLIESKEFKNEDKTNSGKLQTE